MYASLMYSIFFGCDNIADLAVLEFFIFSSLTANNVQHRTMYMYTGSTLDINIFLSFSGLQFEASEVKFR